MLKFDEYMQRRAEIEGKMRDSKRAEREETAEADNKIQRVLQECKEEMLRKDMELNARRYKAINDGRAEKIEIHERHKAERKKLYAEQMELEFAWRQSKDEGKEVSGDEQEKE